MDPRPEIARVVVNSGYDLIEMHQAGLSLEEIFLQLTRDAPSTPTPVGEYDGDYGENEFREAADD